MKAIDLFLLAQPWLYLPSLLVMLGWGLRGWQDDRRAARMYREICREARRRERPDEWAGFDEVIG